VSESVLGRTSRRPSAGGRGHSILLGPPQNKRGSAW